MTITSLIVVHLFLLTPISGNNKAIIKNIIGILNLLFGIFIMTPLLKAYQLSILITNY
ncbi:hypothetical protein ACFP1F_07320 [Companilactobacillus baiquanensis]|uniref:Uncharacterized protein n=1 Tax=Companilactobacillus baiquanensis TaxID=2486005 RepID=A0ABW1UX13_9LACO